MKKQVAAGLLSVTMCASMLAGCAGSKAESKEAAVSAAAGTQTEAGAAGSQTGTAETQTEAAPQETTNIVVYYRGSKQNAEKLVVEEMNKYSEEKIGVTITLNSVDSSEYKDKLSMDLAAQNEIDLCWMANYTGLQSLAEQDALMELSDLLPDYPELYAVMPEKIWESTEYGGQRYFVPNY